MALLDRRHLLGRRGGIPTLGFGPEEEQYVHTALDQVNLTKLRKAAEFYALFPLAYLAMIYDIVIRNGTLVTPIGLVQTDLGISGERIAAIDRGLDGSARRSTRPASWSSRAGSTRTSTCRCPPGR